MEEKILNQPMKLFGAVAFGLPYLLGILMGIGYSRGTDLSLFPNAQMMYPAAGVILAVLITRRKDDTVPRRFYITYLVFALIMMVMAVISLMAPSENWPVIMNLAIILGSIVCGLMLLTEEKKRRQAWGLLGGRRGQSTLMVLLFVALYMARTIFSYAISGQLSSMAEIFTDPSIIAVIALLPVNFFFVFIAFFGEEYGWRYYLQPTLQKRFGMVKGVLFLGVLWGLWHLPINLFYYATPAKALVSMAGQQVTCITLGVFFAYAYMKTQNIWVPVILHYLNNNLIPVIAGNLSSDILVNQEISWGSVLFGLVLNGVLFLGFLLTKYFKAEQYRPSVMNENGIRLEEDQEPVEAVILPGMMEDEDDDLEE
ncbi:MAG: type II CAAX endopeptidase family protein [Eubacterium sp.]|nr:type II CAAX endopeptidase family protein [Eubacterium sp.]